MTPGRSSSDPGQGIAFMCSGVLCMVGLDVCAKWLLDTYSISQLVLLRCGFSATLIFWYGLTRAAPGSLKPHRPLLHLGRSVLMTGSMVAFFYALSRISLAEILTFAFAAPLIVTALSRPLLGESVGPQRWVAVLVGFCGVLVVLQPGRGLAEPAALIALVGAALYALLSVSARRLSATETTIALSLYLFPLPMLLSFIARPQLMCRIRERGDAHWISRRLVSGTP